MWCHGYFARLSQGQFLSTCNMATAKTSAIPGKSSIITPGRLPSRGNFSSNNLDPQGVPPPGNNPVRKPDGILVTKSLKDVAFKSKTEFLATDDKDKPKSNGDTVRPAASLSGMSEMSKKLTRCKSKVFENIRNARNYPKLHKRAPLPGKKLPSVPVPKKVTPYQFTANENVRLVCRVRPSTRYAQDRIMVQDDGQGIRIVQQDRNDLSQNAEWWFQLDHGFYGGTQQQIFHEILQTPLMKALNGISTLVVVYGKKNTGKSYTIQGDGNGYEGRGLIPRGLQQIFKEIKNIDHEYDIKVSKAIQKYFQEKNLSALVNSISYYDLPGETIVDLLNERVHSTMTLRDYENVTYVKETGYARITNEEEALFAYFMANYNRQKMARLYHGKPLEYHSFFTFYFEIRSKFLVDEVFKVSKVTVLELGNVTNLEKAPYICYKKHDVILAINKSIGLLGQAVTLRIAGQIPIHDIPCRQSKLVYALKDMLTDRNTKIVMTVCVSGEEQSISDTIDSLQFASKFKGIHVISAVNAVKDSARALRKMEEQLDMLKMELRMYDLLNARESPEYAVHATSQDVFRIAREVKDYVDGRVSIPKFATYKQLENFLQLMKKLAKDGDLPSEHVEPPESVGRDGLQSALTDTDDGKASPVKDFLDTDGGGDLDERDGVGMGNVAGNVKGKDVKNLLKKKKEEKIAKLVDKLSVINQKKAPGTARKAGKDSHKESTPSPLKDLPANVRSDLKPAKAEDNSTGPKLVDVVSENTLVKTPGGAQNALPRVPLDGPSPASRAITAVLKSMAKHDAYNLYITEVSAGSELYKITERQRQVVSSKEKALIALSQAVNNWIDAIKREQHVLEQFSQDRTRSCSNTNGEAPIISYEEYKSSSKLEHLRHLIETGFSDIDSCKIDLEFLRTDLAKDRKQLLLDFEEWLMRAPGDEATISGLARASTLTARTPSPAPGPLNQERFPPSVLQVLPEPSVLCKMPSKKPVNWPAANAIDKVVDGQGRCIRTLPLDPMLRHKREFEEFADRNPEAAAFYRARRKVDQIRQIHKDQEELNRLSPPTTRPPYPEFRIPNVMDHLSITLHY